MGIYLDVSSFECPSCKKKISVNKIQDFSTRFSKRQAFNCPHCGKTLNWAKGPHNLAHYSMWVAFLTFPIPFSGIYSFSVGIWIFCACLLASATGMIFQKLEIDQSY